MRPSLPAHLRLDLLTINLLLHLDIPYLLTPDPRKPAHAIIPILDTLSAQERHQRRPKQVRVFTPRTREIVCCQEGQTGDGRESEELRGRFLLDRLQSKGRAGGAGERGQRRKGYAAKIVGDALVVGSDVSISCFHGYRMVRNQSIVCM